MGQCGFSCWLGGFRWAGRPELSEGLFESPANPLVFFGEFPIAVVGDLQSPQ
jgi:hypothetical protein